MDNKSNEQTETNTCYDFAQAISTGLDTATCQQSSTSNTQDTNQTQDQDREDN